MNEVSSILADTSILIHFLNGHDGARKILKGYHIHISVITEIELRTISRLREHPNDPILELLGQCSKWDISPIIKEQCITLRSLYRLKLADSIIAATAIALGMDMATTDKDFGKLREIHAIRFLKL